MKRSYGISGRLNVPSPAFSPALGSCQWTWSGVSCIGFWFGPGESCEGMHFSTHVGRMKVARFLMKEGKLGTSAQPKKPDKLDGLVTGHLVDQLFHPERVAAILASLPTRRAAKAESVNTRIMTLQREVTDAEGKLKSR